MTHSIAGLDIGCSPNKSLDGFFCFGRYLREA